MRNKIMLFVFGLFISMLLAAGAFASFNGYTYVNSPTIQPSFSTYYSGHISDYWPILDEKQDCTNREDIILKVATAGCSPAVVRSD